MDKAFSTLKGHEKDSETDDDTILMCSPRPLSTDGWPSLDSSPVTFKTSFDSNSSSIISLKKCISERYKKEGEADENADRAQSHSDAKYACISNGNSKSATAEESERRWKNAPPPPPLPLPLPDQTVVKVEFNPDATPDFFPHNDNSISTSFEEFKQEPATPSAQQKVVGSDAPAQNNNNDDAPPAPALPPKSEGKKRRQHSPKKAAANRLAVPKEFSASPDSSTDCPNSNKSSSPLLFRDKEDHRGVASNASGGSGSISRGPGSLPSSSSSRADPIFSSYQQQTPTTTTPSGETILCQVCGDLAAGFYCSAYICEACKKFFIRASKLERPRFVCQRHKSCDITKESRVHCQFCRYQKCLRLNMSYPKNGEKSASKVGVQAIPCRVCSAPSSGFHFGVLTCEGCKGFFRRMVKEREAFGYKCTKNGLCEINSVTRNMCKACRYKKCLDIGMSVEGSRIGRQPNAVKHAISLEAKKQVALKSEIADVNSQSSSDQSSFNFDSVILDPCQSHEVEKSMEIPHEDCRDPFNSPEVSYGKYSHPNIETDKALSNPSHIPKLHNNVNAEGMPSQKPPVSLTQATLYPHETREVVYRRPSSNHEIPYRPSSLSTEPCYVPSSANDLSMDLSSSSSDSHISRSIGQITSILKSPSRTANDSTFHGIHTQASSQNNYYQPHLKECEFFRNRHSSHLSNGRGLYSSGLENAKDLYDNSHPSFRDFTSLDIKPCICNDLKCQEIAHIDPHSNSLRYNDFGGSASDYEGRKHKPADHNLKQIPHAYAEHHMDGASSRGAPYVVHHHKYHFREHDSDQAVITYPSPNIADKDVKRYQTAEKLPMLHSQPPAAHKAEVYENKHLQGDISHEKKLGISDPKQPLPSPHVNLPSPNHQSKEKEESIDLSMAKSAHHPKLSCKETFSKSNIKAMMDLAGKEIAHLCMVSRAKSDEFDAEAYSTLEGTWERMMAHFHFHAKCIVRFAKKIPGFRNLPLDDQVYLLRASTYAIVVLNHARSYEQETQFYNYFNFTEKEKEKMKEFFPELDPLPSHFLYACHLAYRYQLTDIEYALLSTLLLLDLNCVGISNTLALQELRDIMLEFFNDYEMDQYKNVIRFDEILLCLPSFDQFKLEHNIAVGQIMGKHSQLNVPQLYAEMYNT